jgi:hypothetical protein
VFRQVASGAKTDPRQLRRVIKRPDAGKPATDIVSSYDVPHSTISGLAA